MNVAEYVQSVTEEIKAALQETSEAEVDGLVSAVLGARKVFVVGAGRSGLMMKAFAMRLMHMGVDTFVVGETTTPAIASGDLLLMGSGSGRTGSLLMLASRARGKGARLALVTAYPDSPMAKMADVCVSIWAPTPKAGEAPPQAASIQPMATLFEQTLLIVLDIVILKLMARSGEDSDAMFDRHANLE